MRNITFNIGKLQFVDTFGFLSTSLSNLTESLRNAGGCFGNMDKVFGEKKDLLLRKGVYPYEYMNSFEKFNETKLPKIEDFYSSLNKESISIGDYEYAQKVWKEFEIKNLGEWHDLYLKCDACQLADVFENFRKTAYSNYKLDPAWSWTAPGLSWDGMLFKKGVTIENFSDMEMYELIEKNIRGGMCSVGPERHCEVMNKYIDTEYKGQNEYLMYFDMTNLYGKAMSEPIPIGDYKWEKEDINAEDILKLDVYGERGYFFEVDLEYPKELHDLHDDYPLGPVNMVPPTSTFMDSKS